MHIQISKRIEAGRFTLTIQRRSGICCIQFSSDRNGSFSIENQRRADTNGEICSEAAYLIDEVLAVIITELLSAYYAVHVGFHEFLRVIGEYYQYIQLSQRNSVSEARPHPLARG